MIYHVKKKYILYTAPDFSFAIAFTCAHYQMTEEMMNENGHII